MTETLERLASEGNAPSEPLEKLVKKFSWSKVDEGLTRRLLEAVYSDAGRAEDAQDVYLLEAGPLARQAARSLGSPPNAAHMRVLFPVLKEHWVPRLRGEDLEALVNRLSIGMSPETRKRTLRTIRSKREFLQSKNSTTNSRANFRKAFVKAHKVASPTRRTGGTRLVADADGVVQLSGYNRALGHTPYQHKVDAWKFLDDLTSGETVSDRSALLVLPTGAGKTATAVEWALRRMESEPAARVLWIAHQHELLEQAGRAFVEAASHREMGFTRRLRLLSGGVGPGLVALSEAELDVAITSRQLLTTSGQRGRGWLAKYLSRPTIVIVDEAHHAASPTYDAILDIAAREPQTTLLGLTATPWPSASGARRRLSERFPHEFVRNTEPLMKSGVLATPVFHTVSTHQRIGLTEEQAKVAETRDLPPEVLRLLATRARDAIIVNTWVRQAEQWGKTLVFATSIEHADRLTGAFKAASVNVDCIHSQVDNPSGVLEAFRSDSGPQVLVSVGMLTEGVDVPAARTAFLARPTTSTILMRQMIGRVLRGTGAGGDPHAHIVYLRDQWDDFLDLIEPPELVDANARAAGSLPGETRELPPVFDDTGELMSLGLLNQLAKDAIRAEVTLPLSIAATAAELVGYYELGDSNVPVLAHQADAYVEVIAHALAKGGFRGRGAMSFFEDLPAPSPGRRSLNALIAWIREYQTEPIFHPLQASLDPQRFAAELRSAPAMTADERSSWLRVRFEQSVIRALFDDFDGFEEAVEDSLRNLQRAARGRRPHINVEAGIPLSSDKRLKPLPKAPRDLVPILARVAEQARNLLAAELPGGEELDDRLDVSALPIRFSRRPLRHAWAYWNIRLKGTNAGQAMIVVNRLLESTPAAVPDHVLEYLLYHELLHHLLPGQGHDSEFRRLEGAWPDIDQAELALMTLDERWDTKPASNA